MARNHTLESQLIRLQASGGTLNTDIVCMLTHNIEIINSININSYYRNNFIDPYVVMNMHAQDSALWIYSSTNVVIIGMAFSGSEDTTNPSVQAIYSSSSNISVIDT